MVFRRDGAYGAMASVRTYVGVAVLVLLAFFIFVGLAGAQSNRIDQTERGTLTQESPKGCQFGGECTDRIQGTIRGTPVQNNTNRGITGTLTSDYSDPDLDTIPGSFIVPTTGRVVLTDRDGSKLLLNVEGSTTGELTPPPTEATEATFEGTFTVVRGTGDFSDVRGGRGTITAAIVDNGENGRFQAELEGTLRFDRNKDKDKGKQKGKGKGFFGQYQYSDGGESQEEQYLDAEQDLEEDEETNGEDTFGDDFDDGDDDGPAVSATAEDGRAEASTPGAVASAGGDPDELEPVTDPLGDVEDEIPTSGPLPNTGGVSLWVYALPLLGGLLLLGTALIRRLRSAG